MNNNKKGLTTAAQKKIQLRFNKKFEEFIKLTPDILKEKFNSERMSYTDKQALIRATGYLMYQERMKAVDTAPVEVTEDLQAKEADEQQ